MGEVDRAPPSGAEHWDVGRLGGWRERVRPTDTALRCTLCAMPVVVGTALDGDGAAPVTLSGVVDDIDGKVAILRVHHALAGNDSFGLGNVLVAADALEVEHLPALLSMRAMPLTPTPSRDLVPAPIAVSGTTEAVHLRFLVGTALAAPTADPLRGLDVGRRGIPVASAMAAEIAEVVE